LADKLCGKGKDEDEKIQPIRERKCVMSNGFDEKPNNAKDLNGSYPSKDSGFDSVSANYGQQAAVSCRRPGGG